MAFAARKHEDGTWRLCKRMGDTILTLSSAEFPGLEVKFPTQSKAKACSDALNEAHWKDYDKAARKALPPSKTALFWAFVEILHQHEGLTEAHYKKVRGT